MCLKFYSSVNLNATNKTQTKWKINKDSNISTMQNQEEKTFQQNAELKTEEMFSNT